MQLIRVNALKPGMVWWICMGRVVLLAKARADCGILCSWPLLFEWLLYGDEEDEWIPLRNKDYAKPCRNTAWALVLYGRYTEQKKSAQLFQQLKLLEIIDEICAIRRLLSIYNLKHYDDYTYQHSVNVAIICIAVGASMDMSAPPCLGWEWARCA